MLILLCLWRLVAALLADPLITLKNRVVLIIPIVLSGCIGIHGGIGGEERIVLSAKQIIEEEGFCYLRIKSQDHLTEKYLLSQKPKWSEKSDSNGITTYKYSKGVYSNGVIINAIIPIPIIPLFNLTFYNCEVAFQKGKAISFTKTVAPKKLKGFLCGLYWRSWGDNEFGCTKNYWQR